MPAVVPPSHPKRGRGEDNVLVAENTAARSAPRAPSEVDDGALESSRSEPEPLRAGSP